MAQPPRDQFHLGNSHQPILQYSPVRPAQDSTNVSVTLAERLNKKFGSGNTPSNFAPSATLIAPGNSSFGVPDASSFLIPERNVNTGPETLEQHLKATKPLPQFDSATSLADFLRKKKDNTGADASAAKENSFNYLTSWQTTSAERENDDSPYSNITRQNPSEPVGTGVVALARNEANKTEIEPERDISPIPASELANAIAAEKRVFVSSKQPKAKKFKSNDDLSHLPSSSDTRHHYRNSEDADFLNSGDQDTEHPNGDTTSNNGENKEIIKQKFPALPLSAGKFWEAYHTEDVHSPYFVEQRNKAKHRQQEKSLKMKLLQFVTERLTLYLPTLHRLNVDTVRPLLEYICDHHPERINSALGTMLYAPHRTTLDSVFLHNTTHITEVQIMEILQVIVSSNNTIDSIERNEDTTTSRRTWNFYFNNCAEMSNNVLSYISEHFKRIGVLDVGRCYRISDVGMQSIVEQVAIESLQFLSFQACYLISNVIIRSISDRLDQKQPQLKHIDVSYCQYVDDATFSLLVKQCTLLESVNIEYATSLTSKSVRAVAKYCNSKLKHLNISGISDLNDVTLSFVAFSCRNLTHLRLSDCNAISDASMERIAVQCTQLVELDVSNCMQLTDNPVFLLAGHCKHLKNVNLAHTLVTGESVNSLVSRCVNIERLIVGSTQIDDATLQYISCFLEHLIELDVSFCNRLSFDGIFTFVAKAAGIRKLILWGYAFSKEQELRLSQINNLLSIERINATLRSCFNK